ncbi:MAG: thiamine phosphate synthase [Pseudomonadales bacterium]|nr:thiamine phosphate synthase [Pseudomonadales bacterium]
MQPEATPIIWSIAASDSGGGAGIQADNATIKALGGYAVNIITAITAQNSLQVRDVETVSTNSIRHQFEALLADLPPQAIKIGLLGSIEVVELVAELLQDERLKNCPVVLDPVLGTSTGFDFGNKDYARALMSCLAQRVTVLTPNLPESLQLLDSAEASMGDAVEHLAEAFNARGIQNIVIKGGHTPGPHTSAYCEDYWSDGAESYWVSSPRQANTNTHGTGCVYSSALATALGYSFEVKDALVIAKMTVNQGIRQAIPIGAGAGPLCLSGWPSQEVDLPDVSRSAVKVPIEGRQSTDFASCDTQQLGLYPCVDSSDWVEKLLRWGVRTIQLRIKDPDFPQLEQEIKRVIQLGEEYSARVFINDYWQLAIKHHAYGIHLGQEDLDAADLSAIQQAGIRLGVSSHCYYEVARANGLRPSYIACGPIYPTTSKVMRFDAQGLERLKYWHQLLHRPMVAIGGINLERGQEVRNTGVGSISLITAITLAKDPQASTKSLLALFG